MNYSKRTIYPIKKLVTDLTITRHTKQITYIMSALNVFHHHRKKVFFSRPHMFPNEQIVPIVEKYTSEHFPNKAGRALFLHNYALNKVHHCSDNLHLLHKYMGIHHLLFP